VISNALLPEPARNFRPGSVNEPRDLNDEERAIFSSIKQQNKITKIYLENIVDFQELDFLLTLLPYMVYIKIHYENFMDTKWSKKVSSKFGIYECLVFIEKF